MADNSSKNTPKKRHYHRMIFQFLRVILLVLFSFLTVQIIIMVNISKSSSRKDYSSFLNRIVHEDSGKIGFWNHVLINDLRLYTDSDITRAGNTDDIIKWIETHEDIRNPLFNYILFCTPDGVGHMSNGNTQTVISQPFYNAIMKENQPTYVSNIVFNSNGDVCYFIARPARDASGKLIGCFAGAVKLDEISKMLDQLSIGDDGYVILSGSDGVLLTNFHGQDKYIDLFYSDKAGFKGLTDIAAHATAKETGEGYIHNPDGSQRFISYTAVEGTPWTVIASIPVRQINATGALLAKSVIVISVLIGIAVMAACAIYLTFALKPIRLVRKSIEKIASGDADLTQQIPLQKANEIGALVDGFNEFMEKLRSIVGGVKNSKSNLAQINEDLQQSIQNNGKSINNIISEISDIRHQVNNQSGSVSQTVASVEEISQNIESLERMIETQSSGVTQASAAVEQMIGNISSVNMSVGRMADSFKELIGKAQSGIELQKNVDDKIREIEEQSKTLQNANIVISSIASQTNMLATNAAIEAAHAGEAGLGFSVVAEEIRKLSETSSQQSRTIKEELRKISSSIQAVVDASNASRESFASVSESITDTDSLVIQIKSAMEEQQEGSKQIGEALKVMNDNTIEVRSASSEMSEGNRLILEEVNQLRDATSVIEQSMHEISDSADNIRDTSSSLTRISGSVHKSVDEIGNQIDLFTV